MQLFKQHFKQRFVQDPGANLLAIPSAKVGEGEVSGR